MVIQFDSKLSHFFSSPIPLNQELHKEYFYLLSKSLYDAVESRQNEFIAGRYCAFKAAQKMNHELKNLDMGNNREPMWPKDIIGSITHSKTLAIAVVASKSSNLKVGIDLERIITDERYPTIESIVATQEDLTYLSTIKGNKNLLYTLLFSAKETLYKALFPYCLCFIEFQEARIRELNLGEKTFQLELTSQKEELKKFNRIYKGQFQLTPEGVVTYMEEN